MPWCPNCKAEYREGFSICADCNVELVDNLTPIEETKDNCCKEVYLMSVPNIEYAAVIESLLREYEIPIRKKYKTAGDYVKVVYGFTNFGIDIYVPDAAYQDANEIIEGEFEDIESEFEEIHSADFDEAEFDSWYSRYMFKRRLGAVLLIIF